MYANCEQVLVKGALRKLVSQNVDQLCEFCTEFDPDILRIQVSIMAESHHIFTKGRRVDTLHNVTDFIKKNKIIWSLIPPVMSLVKIVLVMPATNASSECALISLRRVKSYLHTTMLNNCLNHLNTCTLHKKLVKELNVKQVTNDFVDKVERRSSLLPLFHRTVIECLSTLT